MVSALFGVELGGKDVVAGNRRRKPTAVICFASVMQAAGGAGIKTMHKVKVTAIRHTGPNGVHLTAMAVLMHLVPAHLWHLEATAIGLGTAREVKLDNLACKQAQARRGVLGNRLSVL